MYTPTLAQRRARDSMIFKDRGHDFYRDVEELASLVYNDIVEDIKHVKRKNGILRIEYTGDGTSVVFIEYFTGKTISFNVSGNYHSFYYVESGNALRDEGYIDAVVNDFVLFISQVW